MAKSVQNKRAGFEKSRPDPQLKTFSPNFFRMRHCFVMKKFMLGCSFKFEACTKNIREAATKGSLKITEFLLDDDGHVLT